MNPNTTVVAFSRRTLRSALLLFVVLTFVSESAQASSVGRPTAAPGLDGRFVEIAQQLPGFGGYFFDEEGDLNVYVTDMARADAARQMFRDVARNRPPRSRNPWPRPAEVIVRRGNFGFVQLDTWRRLLTARFATAHRIRTVDTDESTNRLFIGVADAEAANEVRALALASGLPNDAIDVEVEPEGSLTTGVTEYVRPVMAGLQINFVRNGQLRNCTLGVNAYYSNAYVGVPVGTSGFFTASHCSLSQGAPDGTVWSQGGVRIGYEIYDPPFFTNAHYPGCPQFNNCRWSDVTFAAYDSGVNRQHGAIAQTLYKTTQWDDGIGIQNAVFGSLDINATWPTFAISQTTTPPIMGVYWDKIGRTTGWTSGPVSRTCTDAYVAQDSFASWNRLCQEYVSLFSQAGDSGAPAFVPTGQTTAAFAGIVWYWSGRFTYVSSVDRIRDDFGYGINYLSY